MFSEKTPLLKFNVREVLAPPDIYTLVMLTIYSLLAAIFYNKIQNAIELITLNSFIAVAILSISISSLNMSGGNLFTIFRRLYIVPVVFFIYSQVQNYIPVVNPSDYDNLLIKWDFAIFGVNPTQWLSKFSFPPLTEYLQISYMTYFIMPVLHGIEIHRRHTIDDFVSFSSLLLFTFYISYLMYFFMPAVGPRFTLHDFAATNTELPGLFLTNWLRELVNVGGGVLPGAGIPIDLVNRDCMPSGHTMITLVNMYIAHKFRSRLRYIFYIFGFSLIFSTVYLRYHYVVDVIVGACFAAVVIILEPNIRNILYNSGFRKEI